MPDSLGDRMKCYENVSRIYLPKRLPVIIRIDGRAFHTFTHGFQRPFDTVLAQSMWDTAKSLCQQISGVKLAYTQSDEISLLLTNDDALETQPMFDNNIQKLVSISASIGTLAFKKAFHLYFNIWGKSHLPDWDEGGTNQPVDPRLLELVTTYDKADSMGAVFDSRIFILPPNEVCNYFIWRQQDATRNSIQMVAQSLYSHKDLQNKNCNELQEMIFQRGINWDHYEPWQKRGLCVIRRPVSNDSPIMRNQWTADYDTPIFTEDRNYIERWLTHDDA